MRVREFTKVNRNGNHYKFWDGQRGGPPFSCFSWHYIAAVSCSANGYMLGGIGLGVVYFNQQLGAAHPQRWSKSSFSAKKAEKMRKKQDICCKIHQKTWFFEFAPKRWSTVLFAPLRSVIRVCKKWPRP